MEHEHSSGGSGEELSFAPVLRVAEILADFPRPWFVSGGWAIDLFIGRVTRPHADIEIGIYRRDYPLVPPFLWGWTFEHSVAGAPRWDPGSEEPVLPAFQVRVTREGNEPREFEFFLNQSDEANWLGRRHPGLSVPFDEAQVMTELGVPVLSPELQLLHKAARTEDKDQRDFDHVLPHMNASRRGWLAAALARYHPEHHWIQALEPCAGT